MTKPGKTTVIYEAELVTGKVVEFSIDSGNQPEKTTYLKHFLEVGRDQDLYFVDNLSGMLCNKTQIVTVKEKQSEAQQNG